MPRLETGANCQCSYQIITNILNKNNFIFCSCFVFSIEIPNFAVRFRKAIRNSINKAMRKDIHPNYRPVVFWDLSTNFKFLTKSCANTKESIVWEDGNEYPVYKVEVSSDSHPFYTGKNVLLDTAGRVDKFNKRYGKK